MAAGAGIAKIVSGGQTGVDRAALDVALELGFPCGGWVPRGRRAEDGRIPPIYPLRETESHSYAKRTRLNVRDSDATLILTRGEPTGGTALTVDCARSLNRPYFVVDLAGDVDLSTVREWLVRHDVRVLNVAGPRESAPAGIYRIAAGVLRELLEG